MLIRTGGGHAARLSIPRDTVVEIPGHGLQKINAAHEFGGPALSISVIKHWLGIPINHLVEVNFENFPQLIDAMGGVNYTGGCIISRPRRRLQPRRLHAAPERRARTTSTASRRSRWRARARTCARPHETDIQREEHQQALFTDMKSQLLSPSSFLRLPLDRLERAAGDHLRHERRRRCSGCSPRSAISGTPPTRVLKPTGQHHAARRRRRADGLRSRAPRRRSRSS